MSYLNQTNFPILLLVHFDYLTPNNPFLLSLPERDSLVLINQEFYFGSREGVLLIKGSAPNKERLVREILSNYRDQCWNKQPRTAFLCPTGCVGKIIGAQGRNIKRIETETSCHLEFFPKNHPKDGGWFRTVQFFAETIDAYVKAMSLSIESIEYHFIDRGFLENTEELMKSGIAIGSLLIDVPLARREINEGEGNSLMDTKYNETKDQRDRQKESRITQRIVANGTEDKEANVRVVKQLEKKSLKERIQQKSGESPKETKQIQLMSLLEEETEEKEEIQDEIGKDNQQKEPTVFVNKEEIQSKEKEASGNIGKNPEFLGRYAEPIQTQRKLPEFQEEQMDVRNLGEKEKEREKNDEEESPNQKENQSGNENKKEERKEEMNLIDQELPKQIPLNIGQLPRDFSEPEKTKRLFWLEVSIPKPIWMHLRQGKSKLSKNIQKEFSILILPRIREKSKGSMEFSFLFGNLQVAVLLALPRILEILFDSSGNELKLLFPLGVLAFLRDHPKLAFENSSELIIFPNEEDANHKKDQEEASGIVILRGDPLQICSGVEKFMEILEPLCPEFEEENENSFGRFNASFKTVFSFETQMKRSRDPQSLLKARSYTEASKENQLSLSFQTNEGENWKKINPNGIQSTFKEILEPIKPLSAKGGSK